MPPPGYEPFLHAICADPEDDAVRLVYADWLDENGDPDRAEFIRLQVAVPSRPAEFDPRYARAEELKGENCEKWMAEIPKLSGIEWHFRFRRGFLYGVTAQTGGWLIRQREPAFRSAPIQFIALNDAGLATVRRVLELPEVGQLTGLSLRHCRIREGEWQVLTRCPQLARLIWLELDFPHRPMGRRPAYLNEDDARELTATPCLPRLERITVIGEVRASVAAILRTRFKDFHS